MPICLTKGGSYLKYGTGLFVNADTPVDLSGRGFLISIGEVGSDTSFPTAKEIHIQAKSRKAAVNALDLISAAHAALAGDECMLADASLYAHGSERRNSASWTPGTAAACSIACRASRNMNHSYALLKYALGCQIHTNYWVDLRPEAEHLRLSDRRWDHVRFAEAIIVAYSVIEQLGLDVRASSSNPSFIDGAWNPKVRRNLEDRLLSAGINIEEPFYWHVRGPKRTIEEARPVRTLGKAEWSHGPYIRDCVVHIVDAIADVSWLRSQVSSHRMSRRAAGLSAYDVANAKDLARKLLLETLNAWPPEDLMK